MFFYWNLSTTYMIALCDWGFLEMFPLLEFPVVLNGARAGVHRVVPSFKSHVLQSLQRANRNGLA